MSVAGMGWCSIASASDAAGFIRQTLRESRATTLTCVAVPGFRQGDLFPELVAAALDVPVFWVPENALQAVQALCQTVSQKSLQSNGFAAVAEGCALAGAGPGAWLRAPRQSDAGITCAVAEEEGVE
ncbi:cobalamin biosynthesis protein [Acetobacter persici]|uniref:cobalamin biosynthesis protein n=1 Tax=Acetobacter persici TaxID=1076596 RepID=UPI0020CE18BD|nr:cobalamin biosynthesis protein [Acetobacter persici]MCP9319756.1 cobalamin biosynthesis protein [Acetobacter persici]